MPLYFLKLLTQNPGAPNFYLPLTTCICGLDYSNVEGCWNHLMDILLTYLNFRFPLPHAFFSPVLIVSFVGNNSPRLYYHRPFLPHTLLCFQAVAFASLHGILHFTVSINIIVPPLSLHFNTIQSSVRNTCSSQDTFSLFTIMPFSSSDTCPIIVGFPSH